MRYSIQLLVALLGSATAAMAAQETWLPWPYVVYPQPVYPAAGMQPAPAQNPYLPPTSPLPQFRPVVPVIPWPFVLVPVVPPTPPTPPIAAPPVSTPAAPEAAPQPVLSNEASQALAQAEASVQEARAAYTLWVPAESALKAAREVSKEGDSAAVLRHAKVVADLTKLGAEQAKYPTTEQPSKPAGQKQAKPDPKATKKPAATKPVPTSRPAARAKQISPRKLCWQGGRLEVCP